MDATEYAPMRVAAVPHGRVLDRVLSGGANRRREMRKVFYLIIYRATLRAKLHTDTENYKAFSRRDFVTDSTLSRAPFSNVKTAPRGDTPLTPESTRRADGVCLQY